MDSGRSAFEDDGGKACTAVECVITDGGNGIWNGYSCQAGTAGECVITDRGYGITYRCIL